jgi:polyisoprenoid-binding protein YceI
MRKPVVVLLAFMFSFLGYSQIYICKDGSTKFTSEAPLELIKAQSGKTNGVVDFTTKNVAFSVEVKTFNGFNSELQKEHFLENYMESEKYPKAIFKGKLIDDVDLSKPGTYSVRSKGTFNIHGVEKEKIIKVKLVVKDGQVEAESEFEVPLGDHDIKVPKIVNQKIASIIMVQFKGVLKPKA